MTNIRDSNLFVDILDKFIESIGTDNSSFNIVEYLESKNLDVDKLFLKFCKSGHLNVVRYLVKYKPDLNLHLGFERAKNNHMSIVKFFIDSGLKLPVHTLNSILFNEVCKESIDNVKYFVELGADPTKAMQGVASLGNLDLLQYLVEKNGNVNNSCALLGAVNNGHLNVVDYLVENGANVNSSYVLSNAAFYGHYDVVKYLVEKGANINFTSALPSAAQEGHIQIVKYLVQHGAKINGTNVLSTSAKYDHLDIVKYLVKNGADIKNAISTVDNNINRFLYMHSNSEQENLFSPVIVAELKSIKSLIN